MQYHRLPHPPASNPPLALQPQTLIDAFFTALYSVFYCAQYSVSYTAHYSVFHTAQYSVFHTAQYYVSYSAEYSLFYTAQYSKLKQSFTCTVMGALTNTDDLLKI